MRWMWLAVAGALAVAGGTPAAQGSGPAPLQGRWIVTGGEHAGNAMDSMNGGVMAVTGDRFEIRTASGNVLTGTLRTEPAAGDAALDLLHADGSVWEAVYEVSGETLRLNYIDRELGEPRPSGFSTAAGSEASVVVLRRADDAP